MQLIQYTPSTREVRRRPLLIVPPWINKFYVLDLQPKNSFIKWAVDQGHTVFAISWVNPDEKLAAKGFENYMLEGTFGGTGRNRGLRTGERSVNAIGYCLGGTLLASTAAYSGREGGTTELQAPPISRRSSIFTEVGEYGRLHRRRANWRLSKDGWRDRGYLEAQDYGRRRSICCAPMT